MKYINTKEKGNIKKNNVDLNKQLIHMLHEQISISMQIKSGQLKTVHVLKKIRRSIASIKYYRHNNK